MKSRISPDIEKTYEQLLWIVRRRFRIVESVSSHFGKAQVERALSAVRAPLLPLDREVEFESLLDERDPTNFLGELAFDTVRHEAEVVSQLRTRVSRYGDHVDEQILFGARTAGQEAGRTFLSQSPMGKPRPASLGVPEAVQAVFEMSYLGQPGEKNHFLILRARGGSSAHFSRAPHLEAWAAAGAEPGFHYRLRCEWVRGVLDILAPQVEFHPARAIEKGEPFGLEHYYVRDRHPGA